MKPFHEFCEHYQLDPASVTARQEYESYCRNLELFRNFAAEQGHAGNPFTATLAELKAAIEAGGFAGLFLATAFKSFYRPGVAGPDLCGVEELDRGNRQLFHRLLELRQLEGWSDQALYEFEQWCQSSGGHHD